jgi:hypothetical protein
VESSHLVAPHWAVDSGVLGSSFAKRVEDIAIDEQEHWSWFLAAWSQPVDGKREVLVVTPEVIDPHLFPPTVDLCHLSVDPDAILHTAIDTCRLRPILVRELERHRPSARALRRCCCRP